MGFSSQSGGRSLGRVDNFCEGLGVGPDEDGEELLPEAEELSDLDVGVSLLVIPEPVEASRW